MNSGIDLSMIAQGFNISIGSLETLITGGVSFGVPKGSPEGERLGTDMSEFKLYDNLQDVRTHMYEKVLSYAMLFRDSVRAPVDTGGFVSERLRRCHWYWTV